ncbi:Zinc-responsiveness transcriptional activator [Trichophyton interdigitale]|uniref:Zinc-responsiveness transcriptional activator n=1 Tax=Trichophyton interdigitale TaxID=101480 RepID=A0A9P4YHK2_9EURO|nr:Zinc-responsiveness transcriptional activator [Trichophyton interdigitale]KAF3896887.1 Zinc-responsiveness transcriptional activator [Trichophyton interdigitale]KAG8209902.1 Zinc-responsiveness transcriptional activator [Trichophyton interdigitale]
MADQFDERSFCWECYWPNLDADNNTVLSSGCVDASCWDQADFSHQSFDLCGTGTECCDNDQCSPGCATICDGFVDCDKSTACSEPQCNDMNCNNQATACFDMNCVTEGEQSLRSLDQGHFFNQSIPLNWGCLDLQNTAAAAATSAATTSAVNDVSSLQHCNLDNDKLRSHFHFHHVGSINSLDINSASKGLDNGIIDPKHSRPVISTPCSNHAGNVWPMASAAGECNNNLNNHNNTHHPYLNHLHQRGNLDKAFDIAQWSAQMERHRHAPSFHSQTSSAGFIHDVMTNNSTVSTRSTPGLSLESSPMTALTSREVSIQSMDYSGDELHICKWVANGDSGLACGITFPDAKSLQEHLVQEHANQTEGAKGTGYYCCWEGCHRPHEPFSQKSKLQGHYLTHSNYKNFQCSICGKSFARQATLERHERSHRGDKPYKCKICGKAFTDSSELKTHRRIHTGEKPFKCKHPGCTFETGDSSNMSSHKLTHGERRHKCPFPGCSKSFTRPDQLKRHAKTAHKDDLFSLQRMASPVTPSLPVI